MKTGGFWFDRKLYLQHYILSQIVREGDAIMARENDELQALVITDPEHRDQAALLLLYTMSPSEEDLLAIVLHVPFLRRHAAERLLATTPKEETLWQLGQVPAFRMQAEEMLFAHYPSHANLVKLLHPTWGAWNPYAAELLLADNPSDAELQAIICTFREFTESPMRECHQKAAQMLAARI